MFLLLTTVEFRLINLPGALPLMSPTGFHYTALFAHLTGRTCQDLPLCYCSLSLTDFVIGHTKNIK